MFQVQALVARHFHEDRSLYLAGSLLTRLQPKPMVEAGGHPETYHYDVSHVDKANVASYDYSAVLYLNTKRHSFEGGDFCFNDREVRSYSPFIVSTLKMRVEVAGETVRLACHVCVIGSPASD